jgi:hypothetical protein
MIFALESEEPTGALQFTPLEQDRGRAWSMGGGVDYLGTPRPTTGVAVARAAPRNSRQLFLHALPGNGPFTEIGLVFVSAFLGLPSTGLMSAFRPRAGITDARVDVR